MKTFLKNTRRLTLAFVLIAMLISPTNALAAWGFNNKTTSDGLGSNGVNDISAAGSNVYVATNRGLGVSLNSGASFTNKTETNGLAGDLVDAVYATGSMVYTGSRWGGLSRSTNNGSSFSVIGLASEIVSAVYANPSGTNIYAGTGNGLAISTDGGASFTFYDSATNGLGSDGVKSIYVDGTTIYVGTAAGLSVSTDGGTSFTNYPSSNVLGVYADGTTIYAAAFTDGLLVSTDGGTSFSNKLPDTVVYDVFVDGTTVYAGTGYGLQVSTDGGTTFTETYDSTDGLAYDAVTSVYATWGRLYAGTEGGFGQGYKLSPEIDVQRPVGTSISNRGTDALGNQSVGTVNLTYTIKNTGDAQLDVTGVTADSFTNSSNFSATNVPASVAVGATETFDISFDVGAAGVFSFDMHIANNDSNEAPYDINISGTGVPPAPEIDVQRPVGTSISDSGTDVLGNQSVGTVNLTYTIENTGDAQLDVTGVTADTFSNSSSFNATDVPANVAVGATETFDISFDVDAAGAFSFDMHIANNDGDEASYDIRISGTGVVDSTPPSKTTSVPADGASFAAGAGPTSLTVTFDEDISTTTATDVDNYILVEAGANGDFDTQVCGAEAPPLRCATR